MRSLFLAAAAVAALGAGGWYVAEWMPSSAAAAASITTAGRSAAGTIALPPARDRADHPQQIRSLRLDGDRLPTTILGAKLASKIGDTLDLDRLAADRKTLRDALIGRGFWAAEVSAPEIVFGDDGGAHVSFRIVTGPVFHIRTVTVAGDAPAGLLAEVTLTAGDDVSPDRLARNADLLASALRRRGATAATVSVETSTDRDTRSVDVTFVVTRGT